MFLDDHVPAASGVLSSDDSEGSGDPDVMFLIIKMELDMSRSFARSSGKYPSTLWPSSSPAKEGLDDVQAGESVRGMRPFMLETDLLLEADRDLLRLSSDRCACLDVSIKLSR